MQRITHVVTVNREKRPLLLVGIVAFAAVDVLLVAMAVGDGLGLANPG